MRRFLPILILMLSVMSSIKADVVWLEKDYDFGLMKEEAGPRTGSVRLVNTGPEPVVITGARPSCGCTGVAYPEDPIEPGDTVNFSFTYNPLGRPGKFAKSIRVYIGDFDMATIRIRGNVLGTPESLTTLYPVEGPAPLRLSADKVFGGEIPHGRSRHFFVNGYNQSPDSVRLILASADKSMSVIASSDTIGPGDIVTFSLYFNSRQTKGPGTVSIPVTVKAISIPAPKSKREDSNRSDNSDSSAHIITFFAEVTPPKGAE